MGEPQHQRGSQSDLSPPGRPATVALSLSLPVGYGIAPTELVALIRYADERGLAGAAVGELTSTDSLALLAAAAPLTSAIRLETSVLSVLTRSPPMLAMSATTMADLSAGRFVLGIGAGSPMVAGYHGQEFTAPAARVARWLTDVRAALDGAPLEEWGSFRLRGVAVKPVPILLAAMNRRMLELAGRLADGVIMNLCGPDQVRALASTALAARAVAATTTAFEVHTTLWAGAFGSPEEARDRFRTEMAPYLAVPTYRAAVVALSDDDAVDRAAAAWRTQGRAAAAALFPESIVDAMVATSPADLAAKSTALGAAGCTGVRVTPLTPEPGDVAAARMVVDVVAEAASVL